MKNLKLTTLALLVSMTAFAQIDMPQPSPTGSVSTRVGLTDVKVDYFRPKVKGRQIFGTGSEFLEQYGKIWRTGANGGSILSISTPISVGDGELKAGEYQILTIPGADEWSVIFYDGKIGGNMGAYEEAKAAAVVKVAPTKLSTAVETMTFNISDVAANNTSANLELAWANVSVKVPFSVSFDKDVMAQIEAKTQVDPVNYVQAANYYLDAGKDLNQALTWMNMYLGMEENKEKFWHVHTKARILAELGQKKEAKATAQQSLDLAKANDGGDFGYIKRNEDLIKSL